MDKNGPNGSKWITMVPMESNGSKYIKVNKTGFQPRRIRIIKAIRSIKSSMAIRAISSNRAIGTI